MERTQTIWHRRRTTLTLFLVAICGCGGDDPFEYVQVSGSVTYDDGGVIPAQILRVRFIPQMPPYDAKTHARPGVAEVDPADGTFDVVTSHRFGDGIVPGKHKVIIESLDLNKNRTAMIPAAYCSPATTPFTIEAADSPFHLNISRPK